MFAGKRLGDPVVQLKGLSKSYILQGGEAVSALKGINLAADSGFYPIRRGEFVMVSSQTLRALWQVAHTCWLLAHACCLRSEGLVEVARQHC